MFRRSKVCLLCLGLTFLFSSFSFSEPAWKKQLDAISSSDRVVLEAFFRCFLRDSQGGFVLFGNKPICSEGILPSEQNCLLMLGSELHKRNIIFKEGLRVWRKLSLKNNHYFLHVYNKPSYQWQQIVLINRTQVLKVIRENLSLFQYVLGPMVTPEELFQKMIDPKETFSSIFREDKVLTGIVFGFGVQNSLLISRKEDIDELLNKKEDVPFKGINQQAKEKEKRGFFQKHFSYISPSCGFATLQEELADLEDRTSVSKELIPPALPQIPWFGCLKSKETEKLVFEYRRAQKKIQEVLNSPGFLEKIFSQFFDDSIHLVYNNESFQVLPSRCEYQGPFDLSSVIAESIYSDLDHQDEIEPFIQGMLAYKQEAIEKWGDIYLQWQAAKKRLEAKRNLLEAECVFKNFDQTAFSIIPNKLYYRRIKEGDGQFLQSGDPMIMFEHTVSNLKGEVLSISAIETSHLSALIPGCTLGMKGMKIGEEREFWIHPAYGYGETSNISPNLGLIVKVKLIGIVNQGEEQNWCDHIPLELASEKFNEPELQNNFQDLTKRLAFSLGRKTWIHYEKGQKEGYSLDTVIAALRRLQKGEKISSIPLSKADELLIRLHWNIYQSEDDY